jgi:hypothetical protein
LIVNKLDTLRDCLPKLAVSDVNFATSLLNQAKRKKLSENQMFWVDKLIASVTPEEDEVPDFTSCISIGSMSGVMTLFTKAKAKLQYPKLRLNLLDGSPVAMTVSGAKSKHPGHVTITDGRKYPNNIFYGRISPEGDWTPGREIQAETALAMLSLIQQLSDKPAETVAAYGKLTGHCAFCMAELSDERSKAVGYGKTCAAHWGLPWGVK